MTTPQDIQAALDDLIPITGYCPDHFHENGDCQSDCAYYMAEHIDTIRHCLQSNLQPKTPCPQGLSCSGDGWDCVDERKFCEASTVDAEALKEIKHDENHYKNLHPNCNPSHYSGWMHGWNACIDELLRRGFRQGGGS